MRIWTKTNTAGCVFRLGLAVCLAAASSSFAAPPRVTTVATPGGGQAVSAKVDAQGTIHLLFDSPNGPQYAKSTDNGQSFTRAIPVVDRESQKPGLVFSAWDMVVGPEGHVHVALGTNAWKLKLPKDEWGFFYARLSPGADAFAPVQNINHKPSEGFSLAADDRGNVTACWLADKLYANVSHDNGQTFAPFAEIDQTLNPCNCCTTSATYGADGKLAILYREETNNQRDMFLVLWDQERNKVTKTRVSTTPWKIDSCPMTYYSVVPDRDGFVIAWPTKGEVYFARLDAKGVPRAPKEIKTPGSCGIRTGVLVLPTTDTNALVLWKKDSQLGWQSYDQRGRPLGSPGSTKSAGSGAAAVQAKNGDIVVFQ